MPAIEKEAGVIRNNSVTRRQVSVSIRDAVHPRWMRFERHTILRDDVAKIALGLSWYAAVYLYAVSYGAPSIPCPPPRNDPQVIGRLAVQARVIRCRAELVDPVDTDVGSQLAADLIAQAQSNIDIG